MIAVLDTSAVVRLFVPDGPVADGLESFLAGAEAGINIALAPDLMLVEVANVLHRKARQGELTQEQAAELLRVVRKLPIRLHPHHGLVEGALELAVKHSLTVYDAVFLELARQKADWLFTNDARLATAVTSVHGTFPIGA